MEKFKVPFNRGTLGRKDTRLYEELYVHVVLLRLCLYGPVSTLVDETRHSLEVGIKSAVLREYTLFGETGRERG